MNRKATVIVGAALVLGVAALVVAGAERRAALTRRIPAWLDTSQPPESIAPDLPVLGADQSWAANACRPMVAACPGYTAGMRVRRTYPDTLADSADSFVRASFNVSGGV